MKQSRLFKDELYTQFARIGKAISSPKRIELLDLISQGTKSVESLAQYTEMSIANVSQHLQVLLESRLVSKQKKGTYVFYELADDSVHLLLHSLRRVSETRLAEIYQIRNDFLLNSSDAEPVPLDKLLQRLNEGNVILLDVRPKDEYEAGHIPGAISTPIEELEKHFSSLSKDKEIVAYCRGAYCFYAIEAVELLRQMGFHANRIEEGVFEYRMHMEQIPMN